VYLRDCRVTWITKQKEDVVLKGFCFIKGNQFIEIFLESEEQYSVWKKHLRRHCILSDIHTRFKVIKILRKGKSASVLIIFLIIHTTS
jgi:hypothetical protein